MLNLNVNYIQLEYAWKGNLFSYIAEGGALSDRYANYYFH